jgi:hypothetical protein
MVGMVNTGRYALGIIASASDVYGKGIPHNQSISWTKPEEKRTNSTVAPPKTISEK